MVDKEDLLDDEMAVDITSNKRAKGRGMDRTTSDTIDGEYDSLDSTEAEGEAVRSIEGWIIFLTGVHEEAEENELLDILADYGSVRNFQLPLDRQTGFVKGYALAEFEKREEAEAALKGIDNTEFMETTLHASWAFVGRPKRT
mmetsp:Transcript_34008/g.58155  ORF Transcript_34008/g.58155 Transcript_34008/m.58155 type:complete len:143 (+) Transcript_34008:33-461(+)